MTRRGRLLGVVLVVAVAAVPSLAATPAGAKKKKGKKPAPVVRTAAGNAIGNGSVATATATCPSKTKAVGGGFVLSPPGPGLGFFGIVYESVKVGQKAWRASAQNFDGGAPDSLSITTQVICRKGAPSTTTATNTTPKPAVNQIGPTSLASCTGKASAQAPGFLTGLPVSGPAANLIITDSFLAAAKTANTTLISSASATNSLTTNAYCANGKVKQVAGQGSTVSTSLSTVESTATCTGKNKMLSGGFQQEGASTTPASYLVPLESQRTGAKTWRVRAVKIGSNPATLIGWGHCG